MEYLFFSAVILLLLVLLMGKGYLDSRQNRKKFIEKLYKQYGTGTQRDYQPGELDLHIPMYYRKHQMPHQIDDITWNDLNLDEIYRQMNYSQSAAGDEYLYYRLHTPMQDADEYARFERHVQYFMEHEKERVDLQVQFAQLGRMGKYSLYEYLDYLDMLGERKNWKYYLAILGIVVSLCTMFLSVSVGICALLIMICINMIQYYKEQKEIDPYITSFRYIFRLMNAAEQIGKLQISAIEPERKQLLACCKQTENFRRNSFIVFSGTGGSNPLEIVFDYLRMILYLDLIKFNRMLGIVRKHLTEIDEIVTVMGWLESAIVVGEYRTEKKGGYCVPVFLEDKVSGTSDNVCYLKIAEMYHPLLKEPVKNTIEVRRGILLTGSNASGKSTFLRAVALNAVLAQTIHTCLADSYQGNLFRVYSSMSLRDDLSSGDSYYMAEVKSIRRILNSVKEAEREKKHVLCFVDEVLRGTNTVERIAASTQILKALAQPNVICFTATHDLELTNLLNAFYENYHFEEEIVEDDIFFPYRLQKGPAVSRNAIALLKVLGYDKGLVKDAELLADTFLQTGKWGQEG